jgi:molybdate transport system regulatory protein
MQIRSKCWIEVEGEPVFGKGRRELLEAIHELGSINQAARRVKLSYRKAWSHVQAMEERLGIRLVDRRAGGRCGGGASLTPEARSFLSKYGDMERSVREMADERFREVFGT